MEFIRVGAHTCLVLPNDFFALKVDNRTVRLVNLCKGPVNIEDFERFGKVLRHLRLIDFFLVLLMLQFDLLDQKCERQ